MDSLAFRYHWNELKSSGLKLARKTDIKNSETDIGLTFSSLAFNNWATFMNSFLNGNKDATSRLLREAVNAMKVEVFFFHSDHCRKFMVVIAER